jgi:hypothetical protein
VKLCDTCYRRRAALTITLRPGTHSVTHRCHTCAPHVDKRSIVSAVAIPMVPEERETPE